MQFFVVLDKSPRFFEKKKKEIIIFYIPTIFSKLAYVLGVERTAQHLPRPDSI